MAKKKTVKYPKLPNGYGSIKKLSGNRRNPYGVYPPVTEYKDKKTPVLPPALAYVDSYLKGMGVLTAYHNGTYEPGMELPDYLNSGNEEELVKGILNDFNTKKRIETGEPVGKTFAEVYEEFYKWKFEDDNKKLSKSSMTSTKSAFKNFANLHDKIFYELLHDDFQSEIDKCKLKYSSKNNMIVLAHGMSEYAEIYKIIEKNESTHLKIKIENDAEEGEPFTDDELKLLWANKDDVTVEMILVMCYSGYRIAAYQNLYVDIKEEYFRGGVKNKTSKDRIVPIHSLILPLVKKRLERNGYLITSAAKFRRSMIETVETLGLGHRTPHDCRHTFSKLCEDFEVKENDRKRMLGHSFGNDITNAKYGHRSLKDLRVEIEKIKKCH